jgi:hypothetical protein
MTPTPPGARSAEEQARLERAIAELFEHLIPFNRVLGIQVLSTATGDARVRFDMKPELVGHPGFGRLHGGVIAAVLDALAGLAGMAAATPRRAPSRRAARWPPTSRPHRSVPFKVSPSVVHITSLATARPVLDERATGARAAPAPASSGTHGPHRHQLPRHPGGAAPGDAGRPVDLRCPLVGAFPDRDLAVLRIEAPKDKLPPIALGSSRDLLVGQRVYAIGNPFGLDQTLTTGIVSALNREIESFNRTIRGVIQTDAAINPGNSGGPLLDSAGRLIGVNTQIASPSGASAGIGFAIPVDEVNRIVPRLIRDGRFVRPALGVTAASDALQRALDLPKGVPLVQVQPGMAPAAKAGLQPFRRGSATARWWPAT